MLTFLTLNLDCFPFRLYCALEAEIAIFDVSNPGINTHTSLKLTPSRRAVSKCKASAGQRGQISCLAVVQDHFAGTLQELLAVGTYTGSIGLYQMGKGKSTSAEERCLMGWNEDSAGVTQVSVYEAFFSYAFSAFSLLCNYIRFLSILAPLTSSLSLLEGATRYELMTCSMLDQGALFFILRPKFLSWPPLKEHLLQSQAKSHSKG